jgi:hypothetical protein
MCLGAKIVKFPTAKGLGRKRRELLETKSVKSGTLHGYRGEWRRFKKFYHTVEGNKVRLPVKSKLVSLYWVHLHAE